MVDKIVSAVVGRLTDVLSELQSALGSTKARKLAQYLIDQLGAPEAKGGPDE